MTTINIVRFSCDGKAATGAICPTISNEMTVSERNAKRILRRAGWAFPGKLSYCPSCANSETELTEWPPSPPRRPLRSTT